MQGGTVFLVEPISGIERQQLDFRSFGQVGGFIHDQPAGLHSSLQCHSDHSSTVQRRTTSWLRVASSSLVFAMSAMAGEGRTLVLPSRYPVATRVRRGAKSLGNPRGSTRFGTEGSEVQILSPRPIPIEFREIQSAGSLGFTFEFRSQHRVLGASN